jgi:hypothetical protein
LWRAARSAISSARDEKRTHRNVDCIEPLLVQPRKGVLDLAIRPRSEQEELHTERNCRFASVYL